MSCSRVLPLLLFGSTSTNLAFAGDAEETVSHELHAMTVERAIESLATALLEDRIDGSDYLDQLETLQGKLLLIVDQMATGVKQGRLAMRGATDEQQNAFEIFEAEAGLSIITLTELFQEIVATLAELEQEGDASLLPEALGLAADAMRQVETFEALCESVAQDLS